MKLTIDRSITILEEVLNKIVSFDDGWSKTDFILDIVNEYKQLLSHNVVQEESEKDKSTRELIGWLEGRLIFCDEFGGMEKEKWAFVQTLKKVRDEFSPNEDGNTMKKIEFRTVNEMVNWLMDNPGAELADGYGRRWKYENFQFHFKDIETNDKYEEGIACLHLYGTPMGVVSP